MAFVLTVKNSIKHGTFSDLSCITRQMSEVAGKLRLQYVESEDRELVRRVLAGQTGDFRGLVDRHKQSIFRFTLGLLGNWEEAEDVAQDTFLAAFTNLSGYQSSRAAFSTWLFTIARNRCINSLNRRRPIALSELDP